MHARDPTAEAAEASRWSSQQLAAAALQTAPPSPSTAACRLAASPLHCREYAAGLSFSAGPFSYLALQLNAGGAPPSLLWSSTPAQRDRLPLGLSEASPAVPPAASAQDGLFFYWSATAPPSQSPPAAPVEPQWTPDAAAGGDAASGAPAPQRRLLATDAQAGAAPPPAPGPGAAAAPAPSASPAEVAVAVDAAAAAAAAQAAAQAVLAAAVSSQTQGLGVVAPEGILPTPV